MRKHRIWLEVLFICCGFRVLLSAQNADEEFKNSKENDNDDENSADSSRILFLPGKPLYSFYGREYVLKIIKTQGEELNEVKQTLLQNPHPSTSERDMDKIHIKLLTGPSGIGKTATIWQFIEKFGKNYHNIIWFDGNSEQSFFKSIYNLAGKIKSDGQSQSLSPIKNDVNEVQGEAEENYNEYLEIQILVEEMYKKLCDKKCLIIFDNVNIPMKKLMHFLPINEHLPSKSHEIPLIVMTTSTDVESFLSMNLVPNGNKFENQDDEVEDTDENDNDNEENPQKLYRFQHLLWTVPNEGLPYFQFYVFPIDPLHFEETFLFVWTEFVLHNKVDAEDQYKIIKDVQELNELLGGFPLAVQQAVSYLNEENDIIRDQEKNSASQNEDLKLLTVRDYIDLIHAHSNSRPFLHDHPLWITTTITLRQFRERAVQNPVYKLSIQVLETVALLHPLPAHGVIFGHALTFQDEDRPTPLPRILPRAVPSYVQDSFNLLPLYAIGESILPLDLGVVLIRTTSAMIIRWEGPARLSCIFDGKNSTEISNLFYFVLEPLEEFSKSIISPLERVKTFRAENQDLFEDAMLYHEQYLLIMETIMEKIWLARETPSYPLLLKYILKFSNYICHLGEFKRAKPWIFHFFSLLKTHVDNNSNDDKKNVNTNIFQSLFHFDDYKLPDKQKSLNFHRLVHEGAQHVFEGTDNNNNNSDYIQIVALTLENLAQAQTNSGEDEDDDLSQALSLYRQAYKMTKSGVTLNKMANALLDRKKYKEAKRIFFDEIYEEETSIYGEGHPKSLLPLHSLAKTYSARGDYRRALEILLEIQQALKEYQGESSSELELFSLSILHSMADAYFNGGEAEVALKLYEQVYSAHQKTQGAAHPDTLTIANDLAQCYRAVGRNVEANSLFMKIVNAKSKDLGFGHADAYEKILDVGDVFVKEGRWNEASNAYHALFLSREMRLGTNHTETLEALEKAGMAELGAEQWEQSIETLQKVVDSRKGQISISSVNPFSLILPLPALAYANFLQGQNIIAKELLAEFQKKINEIQTIPENDPFLPLLTVALHHAQKGQQKQVLKALSPLYDIQKEACGRSHPQTISFLRHFALIYLSQKNYTKALNLAKLCVKLAKDGSQHEVQGHTQIQIKQKNQQPPLNPQLIPSLEALALVYEAQKDFESSLKIYLEVSQLQEKCGQCKLSLDTVVIMEKLAASLYGQQLYALAAQYYGEIFRMRTESHGSTDILAIIAQLRQLSSLCQIFPNEEGTASYKSMYETLKKIYPQEHHPITMEMVEVIAKMEVQLKNWEEALKYYEKLHKIQSQISGEGSEDTLQCLLNMAEIHEKQEKYEQALDLVKKVIDIQNKTRGSSDQKKVEAEEFKKRLERTIKTRKRVQQAMKDEL